MAATDRTDELMKRILRFRDERDWGQFHDPKNLAEAITIEASELLEQFLWKSTDASRRLENAELAKVQEEAADIYIFLQLLCETLGIDLVEAALDKLETNAVKYPVSKARGSSRKYTELLT